MGGVALDYLKMSIDADPFGFGLGIVEPRNLVARASFGLTRDRAWLPLAGLQPPRC